MAKEKQPKPGKHAKPGRSKPGILPEEELDKQLLSGWQKRDPRKPGEGESEQAAQDAKLVDDAYDRDGDK